LEIGTIPQVKEGREAMLDGSDADKEFRGFAKDFFSVLLLVSSLCMEETPRERRRGRLPMEEQMEESVNATRAKRANAQSRKSFFWAQRQEGIRTIY
jgi:hypothetical protein